MTSEERKLLDDAVEYIRGRAPINGMCDDCGHTGCLADRLSNGEQTSLLARYAALPTAPDERSNHGLRASLVLLGMSADDALKVIPDEEARNGK
jgi:hypothetical protein